MTKDNTGDTSPQHSLKEQRGAQIRQAGHVLKVRVAVFNILISVAIIIFAVVVIIAQHNSALVRARNTAANLSAAFEEQVRLVMNNVDGAMELIKDRIEVEGDNFDLTQWSKQVPELAASTIQVATIAADGRLTGTTLDRHPKPIDLSFREHFRVHVDNPNIGMFVGPPVRGRVSKKVTIQATKRLSKPDGAFNGVLVFSLSQERLTTLHRRIDLGKTGSITLVGLDGIIRAHYTAMHEVDPSIVGKKLVGSQALRDVGSATGGSYEALSSIDNVQQIVNWRKVSGYPLLVIIGLGRNEVLATTNLYSALMLVIGGCALVLLIIMFIMVRREVSLRIDHEITLAGESDKLKEVYDSLALQHVELIETSSELTKEREKLQEFNEEHARAKQYSEEANQATSSFLANMSHEIRTP
ncbi:MAG: hypothetical protein P8Y36_07075, partial [Alphaproteobacteria bacterium]